MYSSLLLQFRKLSHLRTFVAMQEMSRFTRFGSQKKLWILGSEPKKQNFQHCRQDKKQVSPCPALGTCGPVVVGPWATARSPVIYIHILIEKIYNVIISFGVFLRSQQWGRCRCYWGIGTVLSTRLKNEGPSKWWVYLKENVLVGVQGFKCMICLSSPGSKRAWK